jgi:poly-beta-1,6-N-acetyl-D-glucosamine synthase
VTSTIELPQLVVSPTTQPAVAKTERSRPMVYALIPAHNEEAGIAKTVRSILNQTIAPDRVIVMADNCTDRTIEFAREAGAWVIETSNNKAKKAGALNQGLARVLPWLTDSDFVMCQDADGELEPDFVFEALRTFDMVENLGGLSGAVVARKTHNVVESAQAIEFARGARMMSRSGGRVHVLSGAATLFPVHALRLVSDSRGTLLPGERGSIYMEDSLTEDYELTLAIKKLGYNCSSTKRCRVTTDVMPTLHDLKVQRLRWFRGAMESMWLYGWSRLTHKIWCGIGWTFLVSLLFPLSVMLLITAYLLWGTMPDFRYAVFFPLFAAEGVVTARRIDNRARILAVTFIPLWIYDNLMFVIYWQALFQALRQKTRVWIT